MHSPNALKRCNAVADVAALVNVPVEFEPPSIPIVVEEPPPQVSDPPKRTLSDANTSGLGDEDEEATGHAKDSGTVSAADDAEESPAKKTRILEDMPVSSPKSTADMGDECNGLERTRSVC